MARMPDTFGGRISYLRRHLGLTQYQLAQKVGVREPDIGRWENDENFPREQWKFIALADALGTTVDYLFGRVSDEAAGAPAPPDRADLFPENTDPRRRRARGARRANGPSGSTRPSS
jgi:transcriptional regulator with XRE-family HTH domain